MKLETTARASSLGIKAGLQHGAAIRAARPRDRAHHPRSPRPDLFLARAIFWWPLFFLFRGIGLHVAPVTILPLQKLPPGGYVDDTPNYQHAMRKPDTRCSRSPGTLQSLLWRVPYSLKRMPSRPKEQAAGSGRAHHWPAHLDELKSLPVSVSTIRALEKQAAVENAGSSATDR
jgi:hypothetical protein